VLFLFAKHLARSPPWAAASRANPSHHISVPQKVSLVGTLTKDRLRRIFVHRPGGTFLLRWRARHCYHHSPSVAGRVNRAGWRAPSTGAAPWCTLQGRSLVVSYSDSNETSNLLTFAFRRRARGTASSPALQRCFRPTLAQPPLAGSRGDGPPQMAKNTGCSPQTVRDVIHYFTRHGLDAQVAGTSCPKRTHAAFGAGGTREALQNSCIVPPGSLARND
jgi:hypothetical protein